MHSKTRSVHHLVVLLLPLVCGLAVAPGAAQEEGEPVAPWELASSKEGDWFLSPLLRLRAAESDYPDGPLLGQYRQMRAQAEANAGNYAAALHFWDARLTPRDTVGVIPDGVHAVDAVTCLALIADTAQVIMVNERHHAAADRLLTLHLLGVLRKKGYRYFAAETFAHSDTTLNERKYPVERTGVYTVEPVFAEVVREALRLGYTLVPYEQTKEQRNAETSLTRQQSRDRAQAQNLYDAIFRDDPTAKVLVHAGFSHIVEEVSEYWYPMAVYFREITGINPVTVDQTRLSERSTPAYEHPAYRAAIAAGLLTDTPVVLVDATEHMFSPADFAVDIQVFSPRTTYMHGRPGWMTLGGRRVETVVETPEARDGWCYIEARPANEPPQAIPLDRTEADHTDVVSLFLPPGKSIDLRVLNENGKLLRSERCIATGSEKAILKCDADQ